MSIPPRPYLDRLDTDAVLPPKSMERLRTTQEWFSVFWELKTFLYGGVLLLTSGLGILVYKNIDTIGHTAILSFIGLLTLAGYAYGFRHNPPFSWKKTQAPGIVFDYVMLLAALCLLIFIGYLQYQYQVFGTRYGLATFIPMVILFFTAYYFDHIGVLCLAITNLAAWAGIAVTPARLLVANDFSSPRLIYTGMALGCLLLTAAFLSRKRDAKDHFSFTYENFGAHLLYIAIIAGMIYYEEYNADFWWILPLAATSYYVYRNARQRQSYYFLVVLTLYTYVGGTAVLANLAGKLKFLESLLTYISPLYLGLSSISIGYFLVRQYNKFRKI